jgi:hypothetical protein
MSVEDSKRRWKQAAHAVQTGIALGMTQGRDPGTEPKHLRMGVNASMCDHAALARLLMAKGVFTEEEYHEAIAAEMEAEKARYERELGVHLA